MSEETIEKSEPQVNAKMTEPPKRRGRPLGSKNKTTETLAETVPVDSPAPKRGRPRKQHIDIDQTALARQIKGAHGTLGFLFGVPELVLDDKESAELASAFVNFAREFDFEPNPKVMATVELIGVMGVVYVPRVLAVGARIRKAKQRRGQTIDGTAREVPTGASNADSAVN